MEGLEEVEKEGIFRQTLLEEARKEAGVIDNAFDGVESRPVEAVPNKVVEKADEVVEKVKETVVESPVEALGVEKKKFFVKRPQQDTRLSLGRGGC